MTFIKDFIDGTGPASIVKAEHINQILDALDGASDEPVYPTVGSSASIGHASGRVRLSGGKLQISDGADWITVGTDVGISASQIRRLAKSVSVDYTVLTADEGIVIFVDTTSADVTLNLTNLASADNGFAITIVKTTEDNVLTINPYSNDKIEGAADLEITKHRHAITIEWTGTEWHAIADYQSLAVPSFESYTTNQTLAKSDEGHSVFIDTTGGNRTVTLPDLNSDDAGYKVLIGKSNTSNILTIHTPGSEQIQGASTFVLEDVRNSILIEWTGATWYVVGGFQEAPPARFFVYFDAGALRPGISGKGGPGPALRYATQSNATDYALFFADGATQAVYGKFRIASNVPNDATLRVYIDFIAQNTGTVRWSVDMRSVAVDESWDDIAFSGSSNRDNQDITASVSAAGERETATLTFSTYDMRANDMVMIRARRLGSHSADTVSGEVEMLAVSVEII